MLTYFKNLFITKWIATRMALLFSFGWGSEADGCQWYSVRPQRWMLALRITSLCVLISGIKQMFYWGWAPFMHDCKTHWIWSCNWWPDKVCSLFPFSAHSGPFKLKVFGDTSQTWAESNSSHAVCSWVTPPSFKFVVGNPSYSLGWIRQWLTDLPPIVEDIQISFLSHLSALFALPFIIILSPPAQ